VIPAANFITDFWNDQLVAHDRQWLFLVLAGLLISFGFIRLSTRLMRSPKVPWWPGSVVSESGVHVHHLVFGIVLMMLAGTISFAGFAVSPIYEICAFAFGVGIGLTIDEFALWVYLDDVYWAKEGRSSIDATVLAVAFLGLVLIGSRPFDIDTDSTLTVVISVLSILLALSWVVIAMLKGRVLHAAVGFFLFPFSLYASCRIGKPASWWARRFYGERNPRKQEKAERRFAADRRTERFKETMRDAIGGSPEDIYLAKVERHQTKAQAESSDATVS
jgi:hypothetical protein